ncbi:synapsin [Toxorhynchites rutilus septentrionalis]|uniref:synapsin n=1 Tax=Toxorhynchites rutilus septentrionalis TaxID=329112 RepID=UPI002479BAF1|nr:synapsin [Toxorhynchites rutilus septentrionalis]XP_055618222.1 synapsin [Toxorhynchites rutilus septentrionalis]
MPGGPPSIPPPPAPGSAVSPGSVPSSAPPTGGPELSLSFGKGPQRGTSAPSSPAKSRESLLQRVQSLTGAARDQGASILGAAVSSAARVQPFNKDKCFTLLVLDDQNTDWSKYFRGKRIHGDHDIRVEQAEFKEISLTANAEVGPLASFNRGGSKQPKSFRPDFILVRQAPRDGARDHRSTLLGLKYGGVPSINSLHSLYQFQDKPWVFAHLLQLQRRLGKEAFPLVEQTFFPSPHDMLTWQRFPCVLKAGHCHGGKATARLDNASALQDAAGLLCGAGLSDNNSYCSLEPYIESKFDVHIQKIGPHYKAFMRKSISGNWKTNQGSAMLEQLPMTEKYKSWIDEVSELFGGMEICGIAVIVSKEGKEFIISASDSTFPLMGDTQEEDRRQIADLVVGRMQNVCRPSMLTKTTSRTSIASRGGSPTEEIAPAPIGSRPVPVGGGPPPIPERSTPAVGSIGRHGSVSSQSGELPEQVPEKAPIMNTLTRRDSQASQSSSVSGVSAVSAARSNASKPGVAGQTTAVDEAEDTMKNLRKTFAGIFGDM